MGEQRGLAGRRDRKEPVGGKEDGRGTGREVNGEDKNKPAPKEERILKQTPHLGESGAGI